MHSAKHCAMKQAKILFSAIFVSLVVWGHGNAIVQFDPTLSLLVINGQLVWNNFSKIGRLKETVFVSVLSKWPIMYIKNYVFQRMRGKKPK